MREGTHEARLAYAQALKKRGGHIGTFAERFGLADRTAQEWLRRAGIVLRTRAEHERAKRDRRIVKLWREGVGATDISRRIGFADVSLIYRVLHREGVPLDRSETREAAR